MSRSEWQAWAEQERRRERRARIVHWTFMILTAAFMALVGYCAIVGMLVVFG